MFVFRMIMITTLLSSSISSILSRSILAFSHTRRIRVGVTVTTIQPYVTPTTFTKTRLFASSSSSSSNDSTTTTPTPIRTLSPGIHASEQTIKKSRFIGIAQYCTSWTAAQEFIESIHKEHPKARHVCFGFVAGVNPVTERCSDDGEPTGTGGIPILGGIKGEGLSDTACAVVRYSGGIKLGAGGLIRAYGGTARLVLRDAPTDILIPKSTIRLSTSASNAGSIYDAARKFNGVTSDEVYSEKGDLEISVVCDLEDLENMKEFMRDATRGDVVFLD